MYFYIYTFFKYIHFKLWCNFFLFSLILQKNTEVSGFNFNCSVIYWNNKVFLVTKIFFSLSYLKNVDPSSIENLNPRLFGKLNYSEGIKIYYHLSVYFSNNDIIQKYERFFNGGFLFLSHIINIKLPNILTHCESYVHLHVSRLLTVYLPANHRWAVGFHRKRPTNTAMAKTKLFFQRPLHGKSNTIFI